MPASTSLSVRGLLFWAGLGLMCLAVALTALLFFLFIISVPLYLLGLVLVLVSEQRVWWKALAVVFPFGAWVGIALGLWMTAPRGPATTFLIPEGFEGTIMVVKNEQCGMAPERQDGRLLYRVPANGLLITRDTVPNRDHPYYDWPNPGYMQRPDNEYFLVDRQGRRLRELTEVHAATDSTRGPDPTSSLRPVGRDELAAFYSDVMESLPDSGGTGVGYAFQYITISTQNRLYTAPLQPEPLGLRALADSLLPSCRTRIGQSRQGLWKPRPNVFAGPADSLR